MKKTALLFVLTVLSGLCMAYEVKSPNARVQLNFDLDAAGQPCYSVQLDNQPVIQTSSLGIQLEDGDLTTEIGRAHV